MKNKLAKYKQNKTNEQKYGYINCVLFSYVDSSGVVWRLLAWQAKVYVVSV